MRYRHIGLSLVLVFILAGLVFGISVPSKGKVNADIGLYLREGPGLGYPTVGAMPFGAVVDIVSMTNGWYKVNYGSYTDKYCSATFIDVIETREVNQDAAKYPWATLQSTDLKRPAISKKIDRSILP